MAQPGLVAGAALVEELQALTTLLAEVMVVRAAPLLLALPAHLVAQMALLLLLWVLFLAAVAAQALPRAMVVLAERLLFVAVEEVAGLLLQRAAALATRGLRAALA